MTCMKSASNKAAKSSLVWSLILTPKRPDSMVTPWRSLVFQAGMFHTVFIHKIPVTQKQAKKLSFPALWNSFMVLGQRETVLACFSTMSAMRKIVSRFMTLGFHNAYLDSNIVLELACSKEAFYQNMTHEDRILIPNDWQIWKYCAYLETSTNSKLVGLYWLTKRSWILHSPNLNQHSEGWCC